jgi:hypothetical protein
MANTVRLKGIGTRLEAVAGGTITPGHLIKQNSSGLLVVHATAGGFAERIFAVENDLNGKEIDDNYLVNDYVQSEIYRPGDEVLAFVVASGSAIVVGDYLESAGDGSLRKLASGTPLATAIEAVDNSAVGAQSRIKVRIA